MTDLSDTSAPWVRITTRPAENARALFLDRDGTVIENIPYLSDPGAVSLIPGAVEAIAAFRAAGFAVVVVTNQSGVARGLVSAEQYLSIDANMLAQLGPGLVDATYACPYHPDGQAPYARSHPWRKPQGGMIQAAAEHLRLDLSRSVLVGDSLSDVMAAADAGVAEAVHVLTGHGARERDSVEQWDAGQKGSDAMLRVRYATSIARVAPGDFCAMQSS